MVELLPCPLPLCGLTIGHDGPCATTWQDKADAEVALAMVEADRKNEALLHEWKAAEARIATLEQDNAKLRAAFGQIAGYLRETNGLSITGRGEDGALIVMDFGDYAPAGKLFSMLSDLADIGVPALHEGEGRI